ncbi:MAG: DMT family transporter [Hydrogenophaga sp.]|uniref:DMT family transporter n=1 Tax=Hydrogenophaga sp. TaxID=1904254 RepID=UPI003D0CC91C
MDRPNNPQGDTNQAWMLDFILLSAVWGSSFMFMRLAVVDFGTFPTATLRAGIGALALLPLLFLRRQASRAVRAWKPLLVAGTLNAAIPTACISFALLSISSGMASIVNATVPLFGALVAFVWLGTRPTRLATIGLCIGFAGVAMLAWDKVGFKAGTQAWPAALAMLAASAGALSGAVSTVYARQHLSDVPALVLAAGSQVGATLGLALPALWLWPGTPPSLKAWLAVAAAGVLCTGLGYLVFFRVLERAGPTRALTVTFVMPLFAMFYGVVFLSEEITLAMLACAAVVIGGTALSMGLLHRKR